MYETRIGTPTSNPLDNPHLDPRLRHRIEVIRALIDGDTDLVDIDGGTCDFAMRALHREMVAIVVTRRDGTHLLTLTTHCAAIPDAEVEFGVIGDRDDDGIPSLTGTLDDLDEAGVSDWINGDPLSRAILDCEWAWMPGGPSGLKSIVSLSAVVVELLRSVRDRTQYVDLVADVLEQIQDRMYEFGAASTQPL
jgi:hypothetical protein